MSKKTLVHTPPSNWVTCEAFKQEQRQHHNQDAPQSQQVTKANDETGQIKTQTQWFANSGKREFYLTQKEKQDKPQRQRHTSEGEAGSSSRRCCEQALADRQLPPLPAYCAPGPVHCSPCPSPSWPREAGKETKSQKLAANNRKSWLLTPICLSPDNIFPLLYGASSMASLRAVTAKNNF